MNYSIFITGTDTDVGKTVVTGLLARFLSERGIKTVTQKWVQTGCRDISEDIISHMTLMGPGQDHLKTHLRDMSPYVLKFPASPHLAAGLENRTLNAGVIKDSFLRLSGNFDCVIAEGSGGALVPFDEDTLLIDIVKELSIPALIVAENRLGAINQTLLTVEALRTRGIRIMGIVFNRLTEKGDNLIYEDNVRIIGKISGETVFGELPYCDNTGSLYENFRPIGDKLLEKEWGQPPVSLKNGHGATGSCPRVPARRTTHDAQRETSDNLIKSDLKHLWHPYTQMKDCESLPPIPIEYAKGVKLFDHAGNFYYDTISSWWCNVHGHNHPAIKNAIKRQLDSLDHVLFAGFTHEPAVKLAEKLVSISPEGLSKVFYSDNGSTAVEVAMKMSCQYRHNTGEPARMGFLSLDAGYHGDTIGAMSVSGPGIFNKKFEKLFFRSFKAPAPYCYRCPCGQDKNSCSLDCLGRMEEILSANRGNISAIIIEPLLMGAGGMIIYPAEYLKGVYELSRKYDVHLIADEVATGFGRTGKMFACEHAGITPDFMCLSKGITSGSLPLGATLTTDDIFRAFYDDHDKLKTFYHGHTFTGNPLSCAAALASTGLFESERTLERVPEINARLAAFLDAMSGLKTVGDTRHIGVVGAVELVKDKGTKEPFGLKERIGYEIYKEGLRHHLLLRPLGHIIYFFLPLCVNAEELDDIFHKASTVFEKTFGAGKQTKMSH